MGFDMQLIRKIDIPSRPQKMTLAPALTRKQNGKYVKRLDFKIESRYITGDSIQQHKIE